MESWGNLVSNLEGDEIESIFQSVSNLCLDASETNTRPPLDTTRHDSGVSVVSAKEEDTNIAPTTQITSSAHDKIGSANAKQKPTKEDFNNALWVTTKLNGITQYRAPRHTTSPTTSLPYTSIPHTAIAKESTAIDLSTSASSFALQCAAAGFSKTLCWDTNPWNIEGLRRSCVKDKWHIQIHHRDDLDKDRSVKVAAKTRLIAYTESQENALTRIEKIKPHIPPIRCVRCEDLSASQETAAAALDQKLGGWIYVQASFGTEFVVSSANQIRAEIEESIKSLDGKRGYLTDLQGSVRRPTVEHIQRGGSHALGVVNCVVVVYIPPLRI